MGSRSCPSSVLRILLYWRKTLVAMAVLWMSVAGAQTIKMMPSTANSELGRPLSELHHLAYGEREDAPTSVDVIAQSADGFIWLAGQQGLLRFDGLRFVPASSSPALPNRKILAMHAEDDGSMWVGFSTGGLARITRQGTLSMIEAPLIPSGSLFAIVRGPDAALWIATTHGVARQSEGKWVPVGREQGYEGSQPEDMSYFRGRLRILDAAGAWLFDPASQRFQHEDRQLSIDEEWRALGTPSRLYDEENDGAAMADSSGALWVAVKEGFERIRWIASPNGKTLKISESFTKADGLTSNDVLSFFEDREHNVWVLTGSGIDRFRPTAFHPYVLPGNIAYPGLVLGTDGHIWIYNNWLPPFATMPSGPKSLSNLPDGVRAALHDMQANVWLAGYRGLSVAHGTQVQKVTVPAELKAVGSRYQALGMDRTGALWVSATGFGLYRYYRQEWTRMDGNGFPPSPPISMATDSSGNLWLGYPDSTLVRSSAATTETFGPSQNLTIGTVKVIATRRATIWVGGDKGLFVLQGSHFEQLRGQNDEDFHGLSGIVETADGDLWVSGATGVFHIAAAELNRARQQGPRYLVALQRFNREDGLTAFSDKLRPLPTLMEGDDGHIWFASSSSVSWIDPQHIPHNPVAPSTKIDSLTEGGRTHGAGGFVHLPPHPGRVEIAFTAASYANPQRVSFRYRLSGIDEQWQQTRSRSATYTNLTPGKYHLEVQAANEDGVMDPRVASLDFSVAAAWYQTPLFRAACVVTALALLAIAVALRTRYVHARAMATFEARLGERERIARELHDTLLQDIQGLLIRLQAWAANPALPSSHRLELNGAESEARTALVEGRDRIASLRREQGQSLVDVIRAIGQDFAATHGLPFALAQEGSPSLLDEYECIEIRSIVQEALRNAFAHSGGTRVTVKLRHAWNCLRITIADDGVGISHDVLTAGKTGHWGLEGMRERASSIGAYLTIHPLKSGGTIVSVTLPNFGLRRAQRRRRHARRSDR